MELRSPLSIVAAMGIVALLLFGIHFLLGGFSPAEKSSSPPEVGISPSGEKYPIAPELAGIEGYINTSPPFTLSSLKGKVVIVDFWTYSCINCIRTQPYLNAWYDRYHAEGLEIIGVHTPEFDFEKKIDNVETAVEKAGIRYPVVLDNAYATWNAYGNRYWPRKYLVDAEGFIRYDHIGEGGYEETEKMIQELLSERNEALLETGLVSPEIGENTPAPTYGQNRTPELYFGYAFARAPLGNEEGYQPDATVDYSLPASPPPNLISLEGKWENHPDYMELAGEEGKIVLPYAAAQVNIVASGPGILIPSLDGIAQSPIEVGEETLYTIIEEDTHANHVLTMDIQGKGFRIYTFTFG